MINLSLNKNSNKPLVVLCLGCHSDDIEIGCGGTILRLIEEQQSCKFHWVVFSAIGERKAEAQQAAKLFAGSERLERLQLNEFRDGFMPFMAVEVKETFEKLKEISPDVIFTHYRNDAHQDHRLISDLTWNTFRNHLILEYEIPKYDGDLGQPNFFIPLGTSHFEKKVEFLLEAFNSQSSKRWFEKETFLALMRLRGMECNSQSGYAEAFYARKVMI
jgi:LmbE family N-acetylglucosaminyl deacetylase